MKQLYLSLVFFLFAALAPLAAQIAVDTVLFEDFQEDLAEVWELFPNGDDTTYVNFDEDGLEPDGGDIELYQWYQRQAFTLPQTIDSVTMDTVDNFVIASKSWLAGFLPGNRNWFILPPIDVVNNSYTLSWKSAPLQLPRYMDGYKVVVSTTHNRAFEQPSPFTDTLFVHAQMTEITGDGESIDVSNFEFSEGYIHADTVTLWQYLELFTEGDPDSTLLAGRLEPHSVSLSQYSGQTVYIAFLHDSDDDNQMMLDDILITRTNLVSTASPAVLDLRFRTYPNPVDQQLNVLYRLPEAAPVMLTITDASGRQVRRLNGSQQAAGEHFANLQLHDLVPGSYIITLQAGQTVASGVFTKR